MIPATYPSKLDENNTTQMVVYYLSNVSGLERWKDYIPVKETPLASPELNSFNTNGAIYTSALSSIVGKQAWVDYIPVYEDSLATDAWTINAVGYLTTKSEVVAKALAVIASYGTDAHVYLPGIGVINGLTAGNYLDSAGTTAATVDNPVGLVLDGAGSVGAELVTNGTFDSDLSGWTLGTDPLQVIATWDAGRVSLTRGTGANMGFSQVLGLVVGKSYRIEFDTISGSPVVGFGYSNAVGYAGQRFSQVVTITGDGGFYFWPQNWSSTCVIDNISVKEVTGIHATQATTANKPILRRGAVNLLLQSQTLNSASWSIAANTSVSTNTTTAPDGTLTADTITFTGQAYFYQPVTTPALLSTTYTFSIWLWSATGKATIGLRIANSVTGTDATFSLISLTSTPTRYSVTRTFTAAGTSIDIGLENRTIAGGDGITGDVIAWGAQLETGSTASTYIPTTTAAASSSTGNYWWQFADSTDVLSATFPAGYESATIINTARTGQVTSTAQNIVGTYEIRGAVIGNELIANGDFSNGTTNWQAAAVSGAVGGASISNVSGKLRVTNDATGSNFGIGSQGFSTVVGKSYRVTLERGATSTGATAFWYVGNAPNGGGVFSILANQTGLTNVFIATATTSYINLGASVNTANAWAEWDNVSIKEITPEEYARFIFRTGLTASELTTMQTFANRLAGV